MIVSSAFASVNAVRGAFLVLTTLALTSYKLPEHRTVNDQAVFDYIVVGAGAAGSIVANRLTEDPTVSVCLIEAGGDPPLESEIPLLFPFLPKTYLDWNFTSENDRYTAQNHENKRLELIAGKGLGGSSTIDHLFYVRGDPKDYDDWVKASGDDSWSWRNLLPYFKKSERLEDEYILNSASGKYHGTNGYVGITRENRGLTDKYLKAFKEIGHKIVDNLNGEETLGYSRSMYTISGGVRQSSAESFLSPIKNRQNLHVVKNTLVTKINFNNNNQATGVQCSGSDGSVYTINAQKEVIVSAGTFNTPKLLMLSGIGPRDHLNDMGIKVLSNLPVGNNLQDHMAVILIHKLETTNETPPAVDPTKFPLPSFIGFGAVNKSQNYPDYMTLNSISRNNPAALLQLCSFVFSLHANTCEEMFLTGIGREALFSVLFLGRPESRGQILLRSANPEEPPKIHTGFLSNNADLEKYVDSILDFIKVTESNHFIDVGSETVYFNLPNCNGLARSTRDYWKCYVLNMMDTAYHYSSTCPMGTVLDSSLRVRGVNKLRVVDASAIPNLASGNINAAVMVLAEKASDLIKRAITCA